MKMYNRCNRLEHLNAKLEVFKENEKWYFVVKMTSCQNYKWLKLNVVKIKCGQNQIG